MRRELLLGCGRRRDKLFNIDGHSAWSDLVTLDINPDHNPDVLHDLEDLPYPFDDAAFDEIHAYECLEHTGQQGDYRFFFGQFSELWRILKPNGSLCVTVPAMNSPWLWGDPSHKRVILPETLVFLDQTKYASVGGTAMSDFRYIYKADFAKAYDKVNANGFFFVLRAVKPARGV